MLGPKFGLFVVLDSNDRGAGIGTSTTQNGYVAGVNAGIFLPVSAATSMGVLLALELRRLYEICTTDSIGTEFCTSATGSNFVGLLGLTGAVLF